MFRLVVKGKTNYFDNFILLLILVSSVTLVLDEPRADPNSALQQVLTYVNIILTILFAIEMGLKIIAFGFILGKVSNCSPPCEAFLAEWYQRLKLRTLYVIV